MRKGPSKKDACITSLSLYPSQLRWLQHEKINRGLSSVAELIRSLVDREMSESGSRREMSESGSRIEYRQVDANDEKRE